MKTMETLKNKYKMVKVSFATHKELKIEAAKHGLTLTEMIDRALDCFIQKRQSEEHIQNGTGGEQPV